MKPILHRWPSLVWLPALVLCLLLSACRSGNREVAASLDRIEQVVQQHPDSSLIELVRLDSLLDAGAVCIEGERQMARYALLKTQTHDKNFIDDTNDSLILQAVRYYDDHGSKREQMLAHYYFACIRRNAKNFSLAYSSFLLSANLAEKIEDNTFAGLSYGNVACICRELYSGEDLYYADLSYKCHLAVRDTARMNWALMLEGIALNYQKRYEESDCIFNRLLHSKTSNQLSQFFLSYYIYQSVAQKQYLKADTLIQLQNSPKYPIDYLCRAMVNEQKGRHEAADSCMWYAEKLSSSATDKVFFLSTLAILQNRRGLFQEANRTLFQRAELQDSTVRAIKTASVSAIQRDYVQQQLDYTQVIMKERSIRYGIILLMLVLFIGLAAIIVRQRLQRNNLALQNQIDTAAQIMQDYKMEQKRRLQAEDRLGISKDAERIAERKSRQKIQQLFHENMRRIDLLSEKLFDAENPTNIKKSLYESLLKEVETFKDPSFTKQLIDVIDDNYEGVMTKVQVSGLVTREKDLRLLSFLIAGFSIKSICLFMDVDNRDTIYKRRRRLKEDIASSVEPFKDELLRLLG